MSTYRLLSLIAMVLLFAPPTSIRGDELPSDVAERIKEFEREAEAIRKKADQEVKARKDKLIMDLEALQAASAKAGKLAEAAAIRDRIKALQVKEPSRILALFQQLRIGMTPKEVEALLGQPVFKPTQQPSGDLHVWYIDRPERKLELRESPWGPAGIFVIYRQGMLAEKQYNFQWIRK